jgi:hypothetical protein
MLGTVKLVHRLDLDVVHEEEIVPHVVLVPHMVLEAPRDNAVELVVTDATDEALAGLIVFDELAVFA